MKQKEQRELNIGLIFSNHKVIRQFKPAWRYAGNFKLMAHDFVSKLLLSLYADFYLPMKH